MTLGGQSMEVAVTLRKILEQLENISESGLLYNEHTFKPEIHIPNDRQIEVDVDAFIIKITAKNSDVKINLDRPITDDEYKIIRANTTFTVFRRLSKIYAQSLSEGGVLEIEALRRV